MGIGKSATCKELYSEIENSVWLDGDWMWMINPFEVNEENKQMVMKNIHFTLNSFLNNSSIENIIFSWVIHQEYIYQLILEGIDNKEIEVIKITLIASESILKERMMKDVEAGLRLGTDIEKSMKRLNLYKNMDTIKIDTTEHKTVMETVNKVIEVLDNVKEKD